MPNKIALDVALNQIIDAVVERLGSASEDEESPLHGVNIVRGDRSRPRPQTPALWVFAETAQPEHNPRALAETWELPIVITPIIKSDDPEDGYRQATTLAAQARSAVIAGRDLDLRDFVQDVRSGRFEASAPWHRRETLYSAVAQVRVIFTILEV